MGNLWPARLSVSVVILLFILPGTATASSRDPAGPDTHDWQASSAVVELGPLEQRLDSTGRLDLPVRGEIVSLILTERTIILPTARVVLSLNERGEKVVVDTVTARTFAGTIGGDRDAPAIITLDTGKNALLGAVYYKGQEISLSSSPVDATHVLLASTWDQNQVLGKANFVIDERLPDLSGLLPPASTGQSHLKVERIFAVGDSEMVRIRSSWTTVIANAYNYQHGMWSTQVNIDIQISYFSLTGANWGTDAATELSSFQSWLRNGGWNSYGDTHQLFSGVDMNYLGFGTNSATFRTESAASVVQAVDFYYEYWYDADTTQQLAAVSGQELGHNNGEWEHPGATRCEHYYWWGGCARSSYNIMAQNSFVSDNGMWFTTGSGSSAARITAWAYNTQL